MDITRIHEKIEAAKLRKEERQKTAEATEKPKETCTDTHAQTASTSTMEKPSNTSGKEVAIAPTPTLRRLRPWKLISDINETFDDGYEEIPNPAAGPVQKRRRIESPIDDDIIIVDDAITKTVEYMEKECAGQKSTDIPKFTPNEILKAKVDLAITKIYQQKKMENPGLATNNGISFYQ